MLQHASCRINHNMFFTSRLLFPLFFMSRTPVRRKKTGVCKVRIFPQKWRRYTYRASELLPRRAIRVPRWSPSSPLMEEIRASALRYPKDHRRTGSSGSLSRKGRRSYHIHSFGDKTWPIDVGGLRGCGTHWASRKLFVYAHPFQKHTPRNVMKQIRFPSDFSPSFSFFLSFF